MNCSICSEQCYLQSETTDTRKIANVIKGKIICNACHEFSMLCPDFCITEPTSAPAEQHAVEQRTVVQKPKPVSHSVLSMNCPKCKKSFEGKKCVCGFKNPMYR